MDQALAILSHFTTPLAPSRRWGRGLKPEFMEKTIGKRFLKLLFFGLSALLITESKAASVAYHGMSTIHIPGDYQQVVYWVLIGVLLKFATD